jgi:hypothetical protein
MRVAEAMGFELPVIPLDVAIALEERLRIHRDAVERLTGEKLPEPGQGGDVMPRKKTMPKLPKHLTGDQLLEIIIDLCLTHIGTATDDSRFKATIEALACLQVAEHSLHGVTCKGSPCPRHGAQHLGEAMLDDINGALTRVFGATGYIQ